MKLPILQSLESTINSYLFKWPLYKAKMRRRFEITATPDDSFDDMAGITTRRQNGPSLLSLSASVLDGQPTFSKF